MARADGHVAATRSAGVEAAGLAERLGDERSSAQIAAARLEVLVAPAAHQQPLGADLGDVRHRFGRRSSASGLPPSPVIPAGGQAPNQLSRAPSSVRTAPEK